MVTTYYTLGGRLVSHRLLYLFDISKKHSAELHRIYILAMCSCPLGKLLKQVALPYTFADNHGTEMGNLARMLKVIRREVQCCC